MGKEKRLQNIRTLKQIAAATHQNKFILDFPLCIADGISDSESKAEQCNTNRSFLEVGVKKKKKKGEVESAKFSLYLILF